jgi:hypothetical protein
MMTGGRAQRAPAILTCVLAALATAAFAHAVIGLLGTLGIAADDDAYAAHAHAAVGPVGLVAAALLFGLLLRVALGATARRTGLDPVIGLARSMARADLRLPVCAVGATGFATLAGMEFLEQLAAFGHADLAAALGGNPLLGASVVALTAFVVTIVGARCAHALVDAAIAASRAVATLVTITAGTGDALTGRLAAAPVRISAGVLLARRRPSRAPPVRH